MQQYNSTLVDLRRFIMNAPHRPLNAIVPELPKADRRPTLIRPHSVRDGIFGGWGPKL